MNKLLFTGACACVFSAGVTCSHADPVFADDFNSYANGTLATQGPWLVTGTTVTTPIQVNSGVVSLGTSGEDIYAPLLTPLSNTTGTSLFLGATINVSSAQATGDYFLHLTTTVGSTSGFFDKIFAKSSGSGFVLGGSDNSSTGTYGSTVLSFGTSYRIVLEEDHVAGDKNDTFELYVNPTDLSVAGNNTAYETFTWTSTTSEPASLAGVNFRQGSATQAPALTIDDVDVSTLFSDASSFTPEVVPEPSTMALLGLSAVGLFFLRRRKA